MHLRVFVRTAALVGFALLASISTAATITPGNLVIYRVGDGGAALAGTATAVFLDEYTTAGTLVQSIPVSSTGASALTATGNAATEGIISPSLDGTALLFTGYRKAAGGAAPANDTYTTTNRVVGTVTLTGVPDTSTALSSDGGVTTANSIRSAVSVNPTTGSGYWTSTSSRVGYGSSGLGATGGTTQIDARNSRQVYLADNTLYASNGSTSITNKIQSYGTFPTSATSPAGVVTLTTSDVVNGFVLLDLKPSIAGADTIYAPNTATNVLMKYTFDGTAWSASGTLPLTSTAATGAADITGTVSGGIATLYLTSGSTLSSLVDSSGYGGTLAGTFTSLATAGTNTAFRGIGSFIVVPEPTSLVLLAIGCCLVRGRRRFA